MARWRCDGDTLHLRPVSIAPPSHPVLPCRSHHAYSQAWTPHVLTTDTQRHLDPILKYADAKEARLACETTEDALSIVMAYIAPKVAEKGALGDPTRGLDTLDVEVSSSTCKMESVWVRVRVQGDQHGERDMLVRFCPAVTSASILIPIRRSQSAETRSRSCAGSLACTAPTGHTSTATASGLAAAVRPSECLKRR